MAANDPRLGKKNMTPGEKYGETEFRPSQTLSGRPIDEGIPYSTMGISDDGYFVVLDMKISNERRDVLIAELTGEIKKTSKVSSKATASE